MSTSPGLFSTALASLDLAELSRYSVHATESDVMAALSRTSVESGRLDLADFAALLSPSATRQLESIARRSQDLTVQRFGRAKRLFAPLYVSNACLSSCTYCGFARKLPVTRQTLDLDQVVAEARLLTARGFRHLLLVAGEHRVEVSPEFLVECVRRLRSFVPSLSIETQTWSGAAYSELVQAGLEGVVHYQETYDRQRYAQVHPAGWKRDFDRRLNAMEQAGQAGARRLGLGVLLGLGPDWRADVLALAAHAAFLARRYWRAEVTVSLPRIKPSASGFAALSPVDDVEFTQAIAALRLFEPTAGIVLSTREPARLRDGLARIAVTHLSAGSSTEPGGYATPGHAQEQFAISDDRSLDEVAAALRAAGYEPVTKDAFPLHDPLNDSCAA